MAVLIDEPRWWFRGRRWSHLVSDASLDELHEFAGRAGIRAGASRAITTTCRRTTAMRCSNWARSSWRAASSSADCVKPGCDCRRRSGERGRRPPDRHGRRALAYAPARAAPLRLRRFRRARRLPSRHGLVVVDVGRRAGSARGPLPRLRDGSARPRESPVPEDPAEYTRDGALDRPRRGARHARRPRGARRPLARRLPRAGPCRDAARGRPRHRGAEHGAGLPRPGKREQWNERSRRNAHRFGVPVQAAELNLQHDSVVMDRVKEIADAGVDPRRRRRSARVHRRRRVPRGPRMPHARFVAVAGGDHAMHEESHAAEVAG